MILRRSLAILTVAVLSAGAAIGCIGSSDKRSHPRPEIPQLTPADSAAMAEIAAASEVWEGGKAEMPRADSASRYRSLTDADFEIVAKELNVEIAAIKAVVRIEAGAAMQGFWAPGVPVVNFDRTLYRSYGSKAVNKRGNPNAKVPKGLKGFPLKRWTTLTKMRRINAEGADMGTLWGMFQIGGFSYKLCGCKSIGEFVKLMSRSEFDQLELFAAFVLNTGYVNYIRRKDWAGFARCYNGPSYAKRGYHTKMAAAYAKFKKANI